MILRTGHSISQRLVGDLSKLPQTIANIEDVKQFVRASGSIGANYIEANEAIEKKDFVMKVKICRRGSQGEWLLATPARYR